VFTEVKSKIFQLRDTLTPITKPLLQIDIYLSSHQHETKNMTSSVPSRRKLAAILAADVVGYSKKMGESEERTLRNLKVCRAITDESIVNNHGRIFHTAGDSVIAEFASPVDAVVAAVEFQQILRDRNAACHVDDQMEFRVGLNLGDVIVEGDNLYGEGINIAARLESIASPGGICVAQNVFSEVRKKLNGIGFSTRGLQTLKNIDDPIEVFDISGNNQSANTSGHSNSALNTTSTDRRSVVIVQPINTAGGDEMTATLAAGLYDGIASSLMASPAISVMKMSANSGKDMVAATDAKQPLRFYVTGSIQAAGHKLRIFIALENQDTGAQIWSKRFDKTSEDIFEIQDEIIQSASSEIRYEIKEANFERLETIANEALSVPELIDKAGGFLIRDGYKYSSNAHGCLSLALEIEPQNSIVMSMLAADNILKWHSSPYPVDDEEFSNHMKMVDLALQIDPRNYVGLYSKTLSQCQVGAFKESVRTANMTIKIFPNHELTLATKAYANFNISGNIEFVRELEKLQSRWGLIYLLMAYFSAEMKDEAIEQAELLFEELVEISWSDLCASAVICYYLEEPQNHPKIKRFLSNYPNLNFQNCRKPVFGNPKSAERFEVGLQNLFSLTR
jgi:class 3 adenylate cyclase